MKKLTLKQNTHQPWRDKPMTIEGFLTGTNARLRRLERIVWTLWTALAVLFVLVLVLSK